MKTVCIVGAGPGGLVAAKTFLQTGQFEVTVYEKKDRIGGIWAIDEDTIDGLLHPQTLTNLSRFTVAFSDLDWNSIDLRSKHSQTSEDGQPKNTGPPIFPKAWQVNRYLEEYTRRFIQRGVIIHGREVIRASLDRGAKPIWHITSRDQQGQKHTKDFDFLLMASGFFSTPRQLKQVVPGLTNGTSERAAKIIHSSQFKTLKDLFPDEQSAKDKHVLVIGGGNSSGEGADNVALQLSNAQWSSDKGQREIYQGCKVIHVLPRPIYPLPPFHEYEQDSRSYMPIDLKLYDISKRVPWPIESYAGRQPPEVQSIVHGMIQDLVGGDLSDLGSKALVALAQGTKGPGTAYVALTESYPEFVRSGLIEAIGGRVVNIKDTGEQNVSVTIETGDHMTDLDNIGAIIYATGYTPSPGLDFLADDVKQAVQYDPTSMRLPLILEQWQTINNAVPELAFIGFYEGPYWPIEEMQARNIAERWLNGKVSPQRPYEQAQTLVQLRQAIQERAIDVPQYWFNDYFGYMEDMTRHLELKRNDGAFQEREGCPSPARYLAPKSDRAVNDGIMQDLYDVWQDCLHNGRYVARAAFRALQGNWNITRQIVSPDQSFSGTLEGQASFHPRYPTDDKSGKVFDLEYLYVESGTFTSSTGLSMTARRRYVYRYSEANDELSVWFVKPDNEFEVDYLFHNLSFIPPSEARRAGACIAKADHLCVRDMYVTQYTLPLKAIALHNFEIKHAVKGPSKDYVATTTYNRPAKALDN